MRPKLQELKNKLSGQEVFIIGGGYSVKGVNIDFLKDKLTIGINDSYKILPNATALYWSDNSWLGRHIDQIEKHPCPLRFNARHNGQGMVNADIETSGNATVLLRTSVMGFDPNPDNVAGNNGGAHALNLAINMGAKKIYLVGYDMRDNPLKRTETHWHNNHKLAVRPDIYTNQFIPAIVALDKEVRRLGIDVEIINCSPTSAIQCFKKDRIRELYEV
jgi:hypothetical protein